MQLYIRTKGSNVDEVWWTNFVKSLASPAEITLQEHVDLQKKLLKEAGATLRCAKGSRSPYLEFTDTKKMLWFVMKWS